MPTITLYRLGDADLSDGCVQKILPSAPDEVDLKGNVDARLFISTSPGDPPDWAAYLSNITKKPLKIRARESVGAVLLVRPEKRARTIYAATWGRGHHLIESAMVDVQAGIRCALNLISKSVAKSADVPRVRALRSKRVGQNTLIIAAQASARAAIDVFPFSATADQLRALTGRPADTNKWGQTITGGVSIHVKRPEPDQIVQLCRDLEKAYKAKDYQSRYGWIDNLTPVSDRKLLDQAYQWAIDGLKNPKKSNLNISPPALIDWDKIDKFEYRFGKTRQQDIEPSSESLSEFLKVNDILKSLTVDDLQDKLRLVALDANAEEFSWSISRCIAGELKLAGKVFVIDDRTLFQVNNDYLRALNAYVQAIPQTKVAMPESTMKGGKYETEADYNERSSQELHDAILLDKRNITRRQATAVEVCDIALKGGVLIHVKRGVSSASLSHLFSQGVVSAELLCFDDEFKAKVQDELTKNDFVGTGARRLGGFKWLYESNLKPAECEIVYVILTEEKGGRPITELPFFSKINLRMRCEELRRMGCRSSIGLIQLC